MQLALRDYQQDCLDKIIMRLKKGVRLQVAVLATGLGKTVIFSHLTMKVKQAGKKTLIVAHREELLQQAKGKIEQVAAEQQLDLKVDIEQASNHSEPDADVIVASVATIGREGSKRIEKFDPTHFGLIVIDEAHHSVASTYKNVLRYFGACKEDGLRPGHPVVLGVTATPNRKDNQGLNLLFDEMVFKYDIKDGIENGWLADIEAFTVRTHEDVNARVQAGDFVVSELSEEINTPRRNKLVVDSYTKIAPNQTALVFAADVQHAQDLAKAFQDGGYKAASVSGGTPSEERADILEQFSNGGIEVVVNCMVLTEGYDNPRIGAVLFARPTTSTSLFIQMAGRGTRLSPGKTTVKFIDFVDNVSKHNIVTSSTLIGLDKPIPADGHRIMQLKDKYEELLSNNPVADVSDIEIDDLDERIKEVDIWSMAQLPQVVTANSKYAWHGIPDGFKLSLGNAGEAKVVGEIRENVVGKFDISFYTLTPTQPSYKNGFRKFDKSVLHINDADTKEEAIKKADMYVATNFQDKLNLIKQDAGWRKEPVSPKQADLLRKFKVSEADIALMSKGEASNLLDRFFSERKQRSRSRV